MPATAARVLVVEDDPTIAEVVARYLTRDGTLSRSRASIAGAAPPAWSTSPSSTWRRRQRIAWR